MRQLWIITLLIAGLLPLTADIVTHHIDIETPQLERSNDQYTRVSLENGVYLTQPGAPMLPVVPVRLVLPPGHTATAVSVQLHDITVVDGTFNIMPHQTPVPISQSDQAAFTPPDASTYRQNSPWPDNTHDQPLMHYYRGYSIVTFHVHPVRYIPATGQLEVAANVEVEVETQADQQAMHTFDAMYRGDDASADYCANIVDNDFDVRAYPAGDRDRNNENLLVIITGQNFVDTFDDFVAFKTRQGFNPVIETVENINATMTGIDTQDRIRNFIIDCYQTIGTQYVLLGGDVETIPSRGFYLDAGGTVDNSLPADLYYSSLDRVGNGTGPDWNTDGDNRWGELGESDFIPEVAVGRISASTATEFANALNKQIMYQTEPVDADLEEALMVGEMLNDNPLTWGGTYKDQIISGGTFDGYTTEGFASNFNVDTMYERDMNWSRSQLAGAMNNGLNLLNHLGHSNTDYNMKFSNGHVTNNTFTANGVNHNFYLIYSQGCYSSSFDYNDAISELFTTISNGCAVYVGNSRYGWYQPGGTGSSSQYMDRQFFDCLFGEDITRVADANNDSRVDGVDQVTDAWFRWTYYELNVLGDPTLDLWTAQPMTLAPTYPTQLLITAGSINIDAGVTDALVGITLDGEHIASGVTGTSGQLALSFNEAFSDISTLDIYITKHDYDIHTGQIEVIAADIPYVVIDDFIVTAGDDDQIQFGESVSVSLTWRNVGSEPATGLSATISEMSPYIDLLTSSVDLPDLNPDETVTIDDAFTFDVGLDVPNDYQFTLPMTITGDQMNWNAQLQFVAWAPEIIVGEVLIMDGDNQLLDPGETTDIRVYLDNIGGAGAENITAEISGNSPYITLNTTEHQMDYLPAGSDNFFTFNISVADETPSGYMTLVSINAEAAQGIDIVDDFVLSVGAITEGFESGTMLNFPWETYGDANWSLNTQETHSGTFAARSGNIGNNASSTLSVTINVLQGGQIAFWKKVSCENGPDESYDHMTFIIDGEEQDRWDGETDWSRSIFTVGPGVHTFSWRYVKDPYVANGQDAAWIDDIEFPVFIDEVIPSLFMDPYTINFDPIDAGNSSTRQFSVFNLGEAPLEGTLHDLPGFAVSQISRDGGRNELEFTIEPTGFAMFEITFQPDEAGVYSGNLLVTSNDPFNSATMIQINAWTTGMDADDTPAPELVNRYWGNYPNPFNPETVLRFSVRENHTPVAVEIYNIRGQRVRTLASGNYDRGWHELVWTGRDDHDNAVSSGIYFTRVRIGDQTSTSKLMLMK